LVCGELPINGLVHVERIDFERADSGSVPVYEFDTRLV